MCGSPDAARLVLSERLGLVHLPQPCLQMATYGGLFSIRYVVAQITPEVLYCAKKAGVTHVLKAGGAQAVAAMAWGTQSCPKVTNPLPSAFPFPLHYKA